MRVPLVRPFIRDTSDFQKAPSVGELEVNLFGQHSIEEMKAREIDGR